MSHCHWHGRPLVKSCLGIDLERSGISVISIFGVHFDAYSKLFREDCLRKRCAIVADADLIPSDVTEVADDDVDIDTPPSKPAIAALEGPYVKAFLGGTTFERELISLGNLLMLAKTAKQSVHHASRQRWKRLGRT